MNTWMKSFGASIFALLLSVSPYALATVQQHTFSISGSNGETGSGSFTWDDATVPDGQVLSDGLIPAELLSLTISATGGFLFDGSLELDLSDCTGAFLGLTPAFLNDLTFFCDDDGFFLSGNGGFEAGYGSDSVVTTLTFSPGATTAPAPAPPSAPIPTMSTYGLVLTMLGLLFVASRRLRASAKRR
jgi:hypothetical protein